MTLNKLNKFVPFSFFSLQASATWLLRSSAIALTWDDTGMFSMHVYPQEFACILHQSTHKYGSLV